MRDGPLVLCNAAAQGYVSGKCRARHGGSKGAPPRQPCFPLLLDQSSAMPRDFVGIEDHHGTVAAILPGRKYKPRTTLDSIHERLASQAAAPGQVIVVLNQAASHGNTEFLCFHVL